ncbi:MAG TPA: YdcF family protein [Patescibacteria group bacterium]|nr:YdcF family protein [Patescibacteria group bacterium]
MFALSKILWELTRPSTLTLLLILAGLWLSRGRWRQGGRRLALVGGGVFLTIAVPPTFILLLAPLENRFPQIHEMPAQVDGIIVLGGALNLDQAARHGIPALNAAAERMTTFVTLARHYPNARLVFTGGSSALRPGSLMEADVARQLFDGLGLDTRRVIFERDSRNTFENAILTKALVDPRPGETWVLVTSAGHMPRSVGIFRKIGWPVLPWPVAYKGGDGRLEIGENLSQFDWTVHEWTGLLVYRLLGRTDALFPAP